MQRSEFLKQIALFSAGSLLIPKLPHLQDSPFTELRNGIGIFTMRGGTIGWMAAGEAIVAIDSQYPEQAGTFTEGILEYGSGPRKFLFNTHHHGDHTGGNSVFSGLNYEIIGHENVPGLQRMSARDSDNEPTVPETTFNEEYSLDLGSETVRAEYYGPAHTGGDSVIWFENANVAHMGDLIFNRFYPFIDRPGGASITGWVNLLGEVIRQADSETLFIFGHGNPEFGVTGNREDLSYMQSFLEKLLNYVREGINAGHSREEITQLEQFEEFPDFMSPSDFLSLPRNLNVAYDEIMETG